MCLSLLALFAAACSSDQVAAPDPAASSGEPAAAEEAGSLDEGDIGEPPPTDGDACSLVTLEDLERITGASLSPGQIDESLSSEHQSICQYDLMSDDLGFVQILHMPGGDAQRQRASSEPHVSIPIEDVPEVPDGFYAPDIGALGARSSDGYVQVAYQNTTTPSTLDQLVALMQAVLAD